MKPHDNDPDLHGRRTLVFLFSNYPFDARPRRAAEALVQSGMEVELICLSEGPDDAREETIAGVRVTRLPIRKRRGGKFAYLAQYGSFVSACFFIGAWRRLSRRYALVHVHNMPDFLVFASLIPRLLGAKVILDLHDPMPELMITIFGLKPDSFAVRALKQLEKLSIGFAHHVLTVNRACRKIFGARSCRVEKVDVVMNSPDEQIFQFRPATATKSRDPMQPFVLMYHGSIVERHGLDLLVAALSKVRETIPHAELRICGARTPFLQEILATIHDTPLASAVHHLGPLSHEQIAAEIDRCDVGVIPNRRNIFTELNTPTRIFEYLSRGIPVIAPSAPGIRDYFGPEDLFYFELGDVSDLTRQILRVHADPDAALRFVQAGQHIYAEHLWSRERSVFVRVVGNLVLRRKQVA